jgi:hypothetical protein
MSAIPNPFAQLNPQRVAARSESVPPVRSEFGKPGMPAVLSRPVPSLGRKPSPRAASALFSLPKEPEDARITGGTRSLDRRLLALNLVETMKNTRLDGGLI